MVFFERRDASHVEVKFIVIFMTKKSEPINSEREIDGSRGIMGVLYFIRFFKRGFLFFERGVSPSPPSPSYIVSHFVEAVKIPNLVEGLI